MGSTSLNPAIYPYFCTMGILSFLRGSGLQPKWSVEARDSESIIWKLVISPSGILAGEERNVEQKKGSLFALDPKSGKMLWRGVELEETWWYGAEKASSTTLYIEKFPRPDMPEARGIIAIDLQSGKTKWEHKSGTFLFEAAGKTYISQARFEGRDFFALDPATGQTLESYGSDESAFRLVAGVLSEEEDHSVYSTPLGLEDELFEPIRALLQAVLNVAEVRGTIDFAEFGKYLIFSYHDRMQEPNAMLRNLLKNELRILDRETGEVVYEDTLNIETPFPIPDNFFINHGTLIYVKEKREIIGVDLAH
jgi:outer membrane protein assembly factor BamB